MKMVFNSYLYSALLCLVILASPGCSGNDDGADPELIVSTESISFKKEGGDVVLHIKTNTQWNLVSSQSWCAVSPSSGEGAGTIKLTATATENTGTDARNAVITVTAGNQSRQVSVAQEAGSLLIVKKSEYDIEAAGESIVIELQTSSAHEISIVGDWISRPSARAVSAVSETFIIAANRNVLDREGSITFQVADLSETVIIRQKGEPLTIASDKTGMENNAVTLAANMGLGWNLGNSLEATGGTTANETTWGNPKTTKALIDGVKAAGFNTIRIPCAWTAYIEDETTYRIKDSWLARVKEVVDCCVDNSLYAIINIHWDGGWLENNPTYAKQEAVNKKQKALWEQIAVYFRDYDEHLLFAGTNEVHVDYGAPSNENINVQLSFNQTFVDAVRSTGGRNTWRNLLVQSYNTDINLAVKHLKMPADPSANRLMAEVHYYDPYEFALTEENTVFLWGKDFTGAGTASWGQEDWLEAQFAKMKTNFTDKGTPVVLGEYGAILRTSLGATDYANHVKARNYYLKSVAKTALENGMVPCYWDNGPTGDKSSGLFNRSTGAPVHSDAIQAIVSAAE